MEHVLRHQVPHGVQILPTKMDFKTKFDSLGYWFKDKARLVVLGNLEYMTMLDYYSPTAHSQTLHLLLALAAQFQMSLKGLDISGENKNQTIMFFSKKHPGRAAEIKFTLWQIILRSKLFSY